jgi:transcriptional regulator with XRE-family HTH domain
MEAQMRASTIEPDKIKNPKVRLLFEHALVRGLSPQDLAQILPASVPQIYRWLRGDEPRAGSLALIERACEKLKALPEPGRGAYRPDEARAAALSALLGHHREEGEKQQAPSAEDKFQAQMKRVFEELEPKLTSNEKYVIFVANPGCWQSFIEVLALCRKYGVKLPK